MITALTNQNEVNCSVWFFFRITLAVLAYWSTGMMDEKLPPLLHNSNIPSLHYSTHSIHWCFMIASAYFIIAYCYE